MKRYYLTGLAVGVMSVFVMWNIADASLVNRGIGTSVFGSYNLIYDTDYDITWYAYNKSEAPWEEQMVWANTLIVTFDGTDLDDWRLPSAYNPDGSGPNSEPPFTGGELGHLFYSELGGIQFQKVSVSGSPALVNFPELKDAWYWYKEERFPGPGGAAWTFAFDDGNQSAASKLTWQYAMAVRDGDVNPIPEPDTLFLLGTGILCIAAGDSFRKNKL